MFTDGLDKPDSQLPSWYTRSLRAGRWRCQKLTEEEAPAMQVCFMFCTLMPLQFVEPTVCVISGMERNTIMRTQQLFCIIQENPDYRMIILFYSNQRVLITGQ